MLKNYRIHMVIGAIGLVVTAALILVYNVISAPPAASEIKSVTSYNALIGSAKPVEGWYICVDLGEGPVPGRVKPRQRFILCHPDNWETKAYCMNPDLPNPPLGTECTRISDFMYWCGNGVQPLKEYVEPPPPTPNFTPTYTPTPTPTETPTPTATPTQRPNPGGLGYGDILSGRVYPVQPTPSRQPVDNSHPSTDNEFGFNITDDGMEADFYGIDFNDQEQWIRIKITPPDKRVNSGKPIIINFKPGVTCEFGNKSACVNTAVNENFGKTIFLTIHSGIGGEAQAYRHSMEGTAIDGAAFGIKEIQKNVKALAGADVVINQGKVTLTGFTLAGTSRVPPLNVVKYFELPIMDAFRLAAQIDPLMSPFVSANQTQIIFETCGWKVPGEKLAPGLNSSRSSVYIGVIQKNP